MLGTGTPIPTPDRSGPSVAIVVNDTPYIVDFGPGVIRRAAAMSPEFGGDIKGLAVPRIKRAFLTHLHSDHSLGYADLILTPWGHGRDEPLEVYGPEGIEVMTTHILEAYSEDIKYRLYGQEPANDVGWRVKPHTVQEGEIYRDANVSVEAFRVRHGSWPNAFGYRFTTKDRVIVISGDAAPSEAIAKYAHGADVLIHEVYASRGLEKLEDFWQTYHSNNHTSAIELGQIAAKAKPRLLILYHVLPFGESKEQIEHEIRQNFKGQFVIASDLEVY